MINITQFKTIASKQSSVFKINVYIIIVTLTMFFMFLKVLLKIKESKKNIKNKTDPEVSNST